MCLFSLNSEVMRSHLDTTSHRGPLYSYPHPDSPDLPGLNLAGLHRTVILMGFILLIMGRILYFLTKFCDLKGKTVTDPFLMSNRKHDLQHVHQLYSE